MGTLWRRDFKDPRTYKLIGAAMAVHRSLGSGFLEAVYQEALEREFIRLSLPFERETTVAIKYEGETLQATYRPDFVVYGNIIVELKTVGRIIDAHNRQVLHYLTATGYPLAMLLNFGADSLEWRRFINTNGRNGPR